MKQEAVPSSVVIRLRGGTARPESAGRFGELGELEDIVRSADRLEPAVADEGKIIRFPSKVA